MHLDDVTRDGEAQAETTGLAHGADIGLSEFHRAGEAIDRGYQEAKAKILEIKRMQEALIR